MLFARPRIGPIAFAAMAAIPILAAGSAAAQDYYAGKTIEMIVGGGAGGGYDIYARVVTRHLGRFIPGHPSIIVKNMPGASSNKAARYISSIAPKDGTTIGAIMPGAIMAPLLDAKAPPLFDPTKVQYIGTANSGTRICATLKGTKIVNFEDTRKVKGAKFGSSGPADSTYAYGHMHRNTSKAIYEMVSGYPGTPDMAIALERGEIDGICGWDWSSFKSQKPDWLRDNKANVLLQVSIDPHPELTRMGVPTIWKYIADEADRKAVELVVSQTVFHRSYIAPPETPPAQLAVLRAAFDRTMADPQFLEDAKKARVDIEPLPGAKVQEVIGKLYASPKEIVERARRAILP